MVFYPSFLVASPYLTCKLLPDILTMNMCCFHYFCDVIFAQDLWDRKLFKTLFLLVCYTDNSNKSYIHDKLTICTYLLSIILHSNNVRYRTSEYLPIREYSDICMIVSRIAWYLYKHVANAFNIRVALSSPPLWLLVVTTVFT